MVTSPTGKGVIVIPGAGYKDKSMPTNAMFELSDSMVWTKLKKTLQHKHWGILAIPIPKELVYEEIQKRNKNKRRNLQEM